jgi:hypothetical protein
MADLEWTEKVLQGLIDDAVEEDLTLDYKAAEALGTSDGKKKDVTKDVSALANAAGGTIIYGIKEFDDPAKKHMPEKTDPIDRGAFSKERLEHIIANIRPRIHGLRIVPVTIGTPADNKVVYVVEVPQGRTAHQAQDLRYYRRYNFESVPMHDHEVRDVMARSQHPDIEVRLSLIRTPQHGSLRAIGRVSLRVTYHNVGAIYAQYVNGFVQIPVSIAGDDCEQNEWLVTIDGQQYKEKFFANVHRDLVAYKSGMPALGPDFRGVPGQAYYVTRYDPVLPQMSRSSLCDLQVDERRAPRILGHLK